VPEEQEFKGTAHVPVLLHETLEFLRPRPGGRYLDGTLGAAGHTRAILEAAGGQAQILGLDRDATALALAEKNLGPLAGQVRLRHLPFSRFDEALAEAGWDTVDGALVDLGVSSMQLDTPERGFSFLSDGPLDMRMDQTGGADGEAPAKNLVMKASADRLRQIIRDLGQDPMAGRIARAIERARAEEPIETTAQLAAIVERAYPAKWRRESRNHPATRTFQALRMAVNEELTELETFLDKIGAHLSPGGRVAVISFHSLEDGMVKHFLRRAAKGCVCPPRQPVCTCEHRPLFTILTKKPVEAGEEERQANPRSRSAKLRAAERLPEGGAVPAQTAEDAPWKSKKARRVRP
jgi:16S rRNA (cytosine1402-N4)-methyltransferase